MLTWREATRRDGILLLEPMASGNKEADEGLRQALLWLAPQAGDERFYDTWLQRHPQDSEIQAYYRKNVGGSAKGAGFSALNSGDSNAAKRQFEQVLQTNPEDADALAGMGYIAQRNGDYQAAAQYLNRAASQGGDASAERKAQAEDAAFYGQLAQAQQALKTGNVSQALALSAPLAQQSGERGTAAKPKITRRRNKRCARSSTSSRRMPRRGKTSTTCCAIKTKRQKRKACCARYRRVCRKNCNRAW